MNEVKDPMMEALSQKRGGLVLKISMDEQGQPVAEMMPAAAAPAAPMPEGNPSEVPENGEDAQDMAPDMGEMDEAMTSQMSDHDKEQSLAGPQGSLGGKARQAALMRMKK